ncbi:hypothetical protein UA32_12330 [Photobacterium angustum]|uniref:Uncharacterized protein n=1 Tax=Photobacterium angustum TaxID=661 RepID=A0ABX5GYH7_PHOAN|nr:hypothetical protein [Photobacterium angustum]KJG37737.1 hypothetical protein UA32_12330 [Photobacterium angustum]PSX03928.1 hypothetical protein C0W27_20750 [Photobacterium angustum]
MVFSSGFKNRTFTNEDVVAVYRNLNNGLFSVLALSGLNKGLVVGHFSYIELERSGKTLSKISRAGQRRARINNTRNVHCYILGRVTTTEKPEQLSNKLNQSYQITYNPFEDDHFIVKNGQSTWNSESCNYCVFTDGKCFVK